MYYSRKIWVHNFCLYSGTANEKYMYMYDEQSAKNGSCDVTTLLKLFLDNLHRSVKTLHIFSNNCPGQNKNSVVLQFLTAFASKHGITIIHRLPERGYSFWPCDRKFALIEKEKKRISHIYVSNEWYNLVQNLSRAFKFIRVTQDMIKDYKEYMKLFFKQTLRNKDSVFTISKYKTFKYSGTNETVSTLHNIEIYLAEFSIVRLRVKMSNFEFSKAKNSYNGPISIKPAKLEDVKKVCA